MKWLTHAHANEIGYFDIGICLSLQELIRELNPILRGWHRYFRVGQGERHFYRLDWFVMNRLRIFVKRKHNDPNRGVRNVSADLFDQLGLYRLARERVSHSDKRLGKVVGEPYRGKPDVRFDEGTKGRKVRQPD